MFVSFKACACCHQQPCFFAARRDMIDLCYDCQVLKIQGELGAAARRGKVSPLSPYWIPGRRAFIERMRAAKVPQ